MRTIDINTQTVVIAAVVNMVLGAIWYSSMAFGKQWSKYTGKSLDSMKNNMAKNYIILVAWALVQSYALAYFVEYADATTAVEGVKIGVWAWVGFVASTSFSAVLFAGKKFQLWSIDSVYYLAVLTINGALLATN